MSAHEPEVRADPDVPGRHLFGPVPGLGLGQFPVPGPHGLVPADEVSTTFHPTMSCLGRPQLVFMAGVPVPLLAPVVQLWVEFKPVHDVLLLLVCEYHCGGPLGLLLVVFWEEVWEAS